MAVRILCILALVVIGLYQVEQGTREVQGTPLGPSELFWLTPSGDGRWSYTVLGRQGSVDVDRLIQSIRSINK